MARLEANSTSSADSISPANDFDAHSTPTQTPDSDIATVPTAAATHAAPASAPTPGSPAHRLLQVELQHRLPNPTEPCLDAVGSIGSRDHLHVGDSVMCERAQALDCAGTYRHEARAEPTVACPAAGMLHPRLDHVHGCGGAIAIVTVRENDELEVVLKIPIKRK